jgi:hypothetical protein
MMRHAAEVLKGTRVALGETTLESLNAGFRFDLVLGKIPAY